MKEYLMKEDEKNGLKVLENLWTHNDLSENRKTGKRHTQESK